MLHSLFPNYPWIIGVHLEYLSLFVSVIFFMFYTKYLFPEETNKWLIKTEAFMAGLLCLTVLLFPPSIFTQLLNPFLIVMFTVIAHAFYIYIKAYFNKKLGAKYALLSTGILLIIFILINLKYFNVIQPPRFVLFFGYISFFFCQSLILSHRFAFTLKEAKKQAEMGLKAKNDFLSTMSHEIRTPMNAILGMGKQLEKTVMDGQQKFFLTAMNSAASNLLVIINDILDFSKIEAGKMSLHKVGFELGTITKKALQVVLHKAEEKGLALSAVIDPNIAPVLIGDPHRINQVLINLLGNSVKFTEKGRVSIHCRVAEDSGFRQLVYIEVVDSGIGMSEEFQKSLFDKFLQEDDKNGKKYSGTGLGMSIVKELVALMKGTIKVESKKNVGTVVSLEIPFEKGSIDDLPKKEEKIPGSNILFNKRILLVEDDLLLGDGVEAGLRQTGFTVDWIKDGVSARSALEVVDYDGMVLDIKDRKSVV